MSTIKRYTTKRYASLALVVGMLGISTLAMADRGHGHGGHSHSSIGVYVGSGFGPGYGPYYRPYYGPTFYGEPYYYGYPPPVIIRPAPQPPVYIEQAPQVQVIPRASASRTCSGYIACCACTGLLLVSLR